LSAACSFAACAAAAAAAAAELLVLLHSSAHILCIIHSFVVEGLLDTLNG